MWDQLTGNERVKKLLKRMLEARRVPGAMLFAGEEGVGKKLFALEIAKALNCRSPQDTEGCGHCPSCVRIGKFNYPQSSESDDWKGIIWKDHADVGMVEAPKRVLLIEQMRLIERELPGAVSVAHSRRIWMNLTSRERRCLVCYKR